MGIDVDVAVCGADLYTVAADAVANGFRAELLVGFQWVEKSVDHAYGDALRIATKAVAQPFAPLVMDGYAVGAGRRRTVGEQMVSARPAAVFD